MVKAVIFDRDGVLVDSEYTNVQAGVLAFEELGVKITEEEKKWIAGRHVDDYCIPLLKKYNLGYDDFRPKQRKNYYELLEETPIFDNTVNLLKEIHSKGIPLALCTSAKREGTIKLFDGIGITDLFNEFVTNEDYSKRKPDPEPYLVTAKKLGVDPRDCLVIEDSQVGLEAAKAAGMKCVVIYNDYTADHDFSKADLVFSTAKNFELTKLFEV